MQYLCHVRASRSLRFVSVRALCLFVLLLLVKLQVLQHGAGIADLERVGVGVLDEVGLDEELLHLHVVDDGGVAPGAFAEAPVGRPRGGHSHAAGEEGSCDKKATVA